MSALTVCNPMVFGIGMVTDNLSLHVSLMEQALALGLRQERRNLYLTLAP